MPSICWALGFTACTSPGKPPATMLCRISRPTVPRCRPAPMTATEAGAEQVPQARDLGPAGADRDNVQVAVEPLGVGSGQGERQLDDAVGELLLHRQAGVGEDPLHRVVVRQRLGFERGQVVLPAGRHQVFEQERGDAAPVHVVRDRERHLGAIGATAHLVGRHPDQLTGQQGQQGDVVVGARAGDPGRLALGRARAQVEEPEIGVIRGKVRVHLPDSLEILRPGLADLDRAAVGEQRVRRVVSGRAHSSSMPCLPAARPVRPVDRPRLTGPGSWSCSGTPRAARPSGSRPADCQS